MGTSTSPLHRQPSRPIVPPFFQALSIIGERTGEMNVQPFKIETMPASMGVSAAVLPTTVHGAPADSTTSAERSGMRPFSGAPTPIHHGWPVLGVLQRMAAPTTRNEPTAFQVLRHRTPAQAEQARTALASLPALGPGEPLPLSIRQPMETIFGRGLADVRLHTSPVAEMLGAEAFTTGENIVFAPGRLDVRSPRGLGLMGHELAHVGQVLAFKQSPGTGPAIPDAEEQAAEHQEALIQRIIEQGWPEGPRMAVRQAAPALSSLVDTGGGATTRTVSRAVDDQLEYRTQPLRYAGLSDGNAASREPLAVARMREDTTPQQQARGSIAPPDVDALARQVYTILKSRLRAERDRHQLYSR
jgi:hypothetical protein